MEAPHQLQGLRPAGTGPGPARTFPQFSKLPAEIRVQVWQQAVLEDHAERVVPVAHESWRVIPTVRLMAPSPTLAATAESRAEALRLYPVALPLIDKDGMGVFYMGGRRREKAVAVEETDQSTDEELWPNAGLRCALARRGRVIHISLDRDIFFLGHRHSDWAPLHFENDPSDWLASYTTRSLRRAERARIVRVMGTRLSWPYATWAGLYSLRSGRRTVHEADARLRETFVSVREVYYFVTFTLSSLPSILRSMRHATSLYHFRCMHTLPGPLRDVFCVRYLAPPGEENVEAQEPDEDPYDIDY